MINNYEINEGTLALISKRNFTTKILEDKNTFYVNNSAFEIIDNSCKYFGSSYKGRLEGSKNLIGKSYKMPIIIEDSREIIFFPTISPEDEHCIWIAANNIKEYISEEYNITRIIFKNDEEITVPLSYRAVQNQVLRATRLGYIIKTHKKNT